MKFKEWLKINEVKAFVGNSPVSRNPFRNRAYDPSNVLAVGRSTDPVGITGIAKKGAGHLLQSIGNSAGKTFEDIGLVPKGTGRLEGLPHGEASAPGVKYYSLPLQIPKLKHNSSYQDVDIGLDRGLLITPKRVYKNARSKIPLSQIRQVGDGQEVEINGKFLLLHKENDNEDSWNWDTNESVQFTRALIYKCIVDTIDQNKYYIDSFDVAGEQDKNGILTTWFTFESNRFAEKKK